jgi:RNA polymerase sigma-70 factor, ECF subfamily
MGISLTHWWRNGGGWGFVSLAVNAHLAALGSTLSLGTMTAEPAQPWVEEIRRARRGDSSAFATLVRGLQRQVYGLCLRLLRAEAEASEVAQETFLRAYQNLERFDDSRPFDLWVLTIARNLTEDVEDHALTLASAEPSSEQKAIDGQQRRSLEDAMGTLSADDREVLALYYVQKRTTKEIAVVMGVAPGTIMARLFRAREKLRVRMMATEQGAA